MNDKLFLIVGLLLIGGLLVSFICYKYYTESIIKDQEREIAKLKTENKRLNGDYARKSAELVKLKSIQPVKMQAIEIVDRQLIEAISEKDKETFPACARILENDEFFLNYHKTNNTDFDTETLSVEQGFIEV